MSGYDPYEKLRAYGITPDGKPATLSPVEARMGSQPKALMAPPKRPRIGLGIQAYVHEDCADSLDRLARQMAAQANTLFDEGDQKSASFTRIQSEGVKEAAEHLRRYAKRLHELDADEVENIVAGYGRTAPEGIPQKIWDKAIEEWLNDDTTVDSDKIKRIAKRLMREAAAGEAK